jgi:hypothetical protein
MLRTAFIALALSLALAACVQEPRNAQQEAARPVVFHPTTFVWPPKLNPPRRSVPPGKKLKDLCPPGTSALLFYDYVKTPQTGSQLPSRTFVCFPKLHQQPRPIPPGKKIEDLCPPGKGRAWRFLDPLPPQTQADTSSKSP